MRIKSIDLEGFQSYREHEHIDVDGLDLVAVIGPNGAGKSTLLNAIEFALYGKFRGDAINTVISRGAKQAEVAVVFDLNGTTYRVRRIKAGTRHEVYVTIADDTAADGWKVLTEKNPKVADPFLVNDLLGMDYATARATWMIGQNDFGAFCELMPAQRRIVLTNAFGLNRYADLAEKANTALTNVSQKETVAQDRLTQTTARMEQLRTQIDDPELHPLSDDALAEEDSKIEAEDEKVSEALAADLGDVEQIQQEVTVAETALREFLALHQREIARHEADLSRTAAALRTATQAAQSAAARREAAQKAATAAEETTRAVESTKTRVGDLEGALPAKQEAVSGWRAAFEGHKGARDRAKQDAMETRERLNTLQKSAHRHEGECFACGQALSAERAQEMAARLNQELADLKARHDQAQAEMNRAAESGKEAAALAQEAEQQLSRARQDHQQAVVAHERNLANAEALPSLQDAEKAAQEALKAAQDDHEAANGVPAPVLDTERQGVLQGAINDAREKLTAAKSSTTDRQALRQRRDSLRARQRRIWAEQERRTRVADALKAAEETLKEQQATFDDLHKDAVTYRALRDAFRPAGIPAMVLAGVVEELNDDANDILMDLGGQFGVNITTQREKARGGVDEKVMVYVTTAEGEIDYTTLSGSEKFRCALAIRVALARCIARRTGTPMETLIMDEGWGALDEEYRQAVLDVLITLSEDFSVYTVSHIDEIKASFPTVIEVDKAEGTSRAVVETR